jgi:ABC-type antimicrobial peptide transport system permease subunit
MIELGTKLYGKFDLDKYITKDKEYIVIDFNKESIIYLADNGHKMSVNYNNISDYFDFDIIEIQKKDSIVEEVVKQFRKHSELGITKYGTTLAENETDNFLIHLQEELMDAVNYIEKLKSQQKENTKEKVLVWAEDKNLIHSTNIYKQYWKLQEECNELYQAMLDNNKAEQIDAIGDIRVVITILAAQLNLDIDACFDIAYNEIKDRKGVTTNGTFIREK